MSSLVQSKLLHHVALIRSLDYQAILSEDLLRQVMEMSATRNIALIKEVVSLFINQLFKEMFKYNACKNSKNNNIISAATVTKILPLLLEFVFFSFHII